jgi:hypothetical protein
MPWFLAPQSWCVISKIAFRAEQTSSKQNKQASGYRHLQTV